MGYGSEDADICVLSPESLLTPPNLPMPPDTEGLRYGQDVYFLGFPYGWRFGLEELNRLFPFPLVKKAIVSAMMTDDKKCINLLDGHNNPGFSGGPVVFQDPKSPQLKFKVAGVIASYRVDREPVVDADGNETPFHYDSNTGIIESYGVNHALDAIRDNPIGFELLKE